MAGTPAADFDITPSLIEALLREQHPDLADLPRVPVDAGWDNVMVRLGDELCLRLPRRAASAAIIEHEQTWLPHLARYLPLPVPVPVRTGEPGCGYPWRWSIVPWLDGTAADLCAPQPSEATRLGAFLQALHIPAPVGAPFNPVRGVPLWQRALKIEERMRRLQTLSPLITEDIRRTWVAALGAPIDVDPTWIHGDLHPRNVLVKCATRASQVWSVGPPRSVSAGVSQRANGALTGVIDWGDIAVGDRATDLAAVWMLFADPEARERALSACGSVTAATRLRAQGWAIGFGVILLETGLVDNPRHAAIGAQTLRRVAEGP